MGGGGRGWEGGGWVRDFMKESSGSSSASGGVGSRGRVGGGWGEVAMAAMKAAKGSSSPLAALSARWAAAEGDGEGGGWSRGMRGRAEGAEGGAAESKMDSRCRLLAGSATALRSMVGLCMGSWAVQERGDLCARQSRRW